MREPREADVIDILNHPIPGERCRLRGSDATGVVDFMDGETGLTLVTWDYRFGDVPVECPINSLEFEESELADPKVTERSPPSLLLRVAGHFISLMVPR